jgi:diguanylate cyclase (GGDEF)-like protein
MLMEKVNDLPSSRIFTDPVEAGEMLTSLHLENEALRKQLEQVVTTASTNEKIWRHFTEIERILFRTRQLDVLVEELLKEIKARFKTDGVVLLLCHTDLLEQFFPQITESSDPIEQGAWILPAPPETGASLFSAAPSPLLLHGEAMRTILPLLPDALSAVASGVLIPLSIHDIVFGCLFLGSFDPHRYHPEDGTELLEQLGIKIALCMDNCLAYERVKEFTLRDSLTGFFNFFQIHTVLEREIRKARRTLTPLSILIVDFAFYHQSDESFDFTNAILGHAAGVLREILDKAECYIGRYGSHEFLVILPGVSEEEAREVIPFITQAIRKSPFRQANAAILIQASLGVGTLKDAMRSQDLLDSAYREVCSLRMPLGEGAG